MSRWLLLIGVLVGIGCLKVSQQNAIVFKGYAVAERVVSLQAQQTDIVWLSAQVGRLSCPTRLDQVATDRQLRLVAWSTWPPRRTPGGAAVHQAMRVQADGIAEKPAAVGRNAL
jgi:hypothetical protein